MDTDGNIDTRAPQGVTVGSLPDSVHFTPDGMRILTANEGEPKDYCPVSGSLPTTSDPFGSVSIVDITRSTLTATTVTFENFNTSKDLINSSGARVFGPGASVAQDLEPEYIAISADSKTAFVTLQENNAVAELDIETATIKRIMGLGYKDHSRTGNGLDASDSDSAVSISNWPIKGMYQPDAIATYTASDGEQYFVTANEGDAREYACLYGPGLGSDSEDKRASSVGVDASVFASAVGNSNFGRLNLTRFFPATYTSGGDYSTATGSTDFTSLYTLGARSISVWKRPSGNSFVGSAQLVADTGDVIEQKIATLLPDYFNADWNTGSGNPNAKDSRSDNKGPEPEGLVVGSVFGRNYAFVGLERVGGIMAFDVTNPSSPAYATYINSSDFTKTLSAAGDVSPEGLLFVRASDSPIGVPLLIAAHELSGTTAIYKIVGTPTAPEAPRIVTAEMNRKNNAVVEWEMPEDDGGQPITKVVATASPGTKSCETTSGTTCVITGLKPGKQYAINVKVYNSVGAGTARVLEDVKIPLLRASKGDSVSVKRVPKSFAEQLEIATKKKTVTVAMIGANEADGAPVTVRLVAATGKTVAKKSFSLSANFLQTSSLSADVTGRVRVVINVLIDGKVRTWNGPRVRFR